MTSRLTALAALFAVLATATLAFAASASQPAAIEVTPKVRFVQLERVEIIAHRLAQAPN